MHHFRFPYAKYPAVRLALCLIAGIWIGGTVSDNFSGTGLFAVLLGLTGVWLVLEAVNRRVVSSVLPPFLRWLYLGIIVLFGVEFSSSRSHGSDATKAVLNGLSGTSVWFTGTVSGVRLTHTGTLTVTLRTDSIEVGQHAMHLRSTLQARAFRADSSLISDMPLNSRVRISVQIRDYPRKRNPNAFDTASWLKREGVQVTGTLESVTWSHPLDSRWSWLWWRSKMQNLLNTSVSESVRPLFKAILLGDKGDMDAEVRTAFSRAGLSHLMAVSGMHVGFVLMPVWIIIPWFWTHEIGRSAGLALIASILFFYAGITGFTASVSRASITACLLAIGKLFQRNRDSLNTTGVAAIILLLSDPDSLYDVGFQMSFTAVVLILVVGPAMRDWIPSRIRYTWKGVALQFLGISVIVQAGLFPILAGTFGEFSVAGPLANTAGVPLTQLLFLWSMLALPLAAASETLSGFIMAPAEWLAAILLWIVQVVGGAEASWVRVTETSRFLPLIWVFGAGFIATAHYAGPRFKWLVLLLLCLNLTRVEGLVQQFSLPRLMITVYDVGQGDAILIQTPGGRTILYDTGVLNPFQNSGRSVLLPDLQARGITSIDAIILSHPHADHIGGTLSLIENIDIGMIYQSPMEHGSAVFRGYMSAARERGIPVQDVRAGDELLLDASMRFLVLHPDDSELGRDPNAHSVSILMQYGETSFLLTGDAEHIAERVMSDRFGDFLKADWYKAGHHGSRTSSGERFMELVRPDWVAVSLALSNRYRHPHREATRNMHRYADKVHFTSLHGALVYQSDGKRIEQINWR